MSSYRGSNGYSTSFKSGTSNGLASSLATSRTGSYSTLASRPPISDFKSQMYSSYHSNLTRNHTDFGSRTSLSRLSGSRTDLRSSGWRGSSGLSRFDSRSSLNSSMTRSLADTRPSMSMSTRRMATSSYGSLSAKPASPRPASSSYLRNSSTLSRRPSQSSLGDFTASTNHSMSSSGYGSMSYSSRFSNGSRNNSSHETYGTRTHPTDSKGGAKDVEVRVDSTYITRRLERAEQSAFTRFVLPERSSVQRRTTKFVAAPTVLCKPSAVKGAIQNVVNALDGKLDDLDGPNGARKTSTPVIDSVPQVKVEIPSRKPAGVSELQKMLKMVDFNQETFQKSVKLADEKIKNEALVKMEREEKERKAREFREKLEKYETAEVRTKTNGAADRNDLPAFQLPPPNPKLARDDLYSRDVETAKEAVTVKSWSKEKTDESLENAVKSPAKLDIDRQFSSKLENILQAKLNATSGMESEEKVDSIPLLLVTAPSAPSTPLGIDDNDITFTIGMADVEQRTDSECDDEEEYEYEEYEEWETEDETEDESDTFDTALTIALPNCGADALLRPADARARRRAALPDDAFDEDITLPPVAKREPQRRPSTLPPPPIFTASVTLDVSDAREEEEEDFSDEDFYVSATSRMTNPSRMDICTTVTSAYSSESEYDGNVDVGCTLNLVDRAALADSDACSDEDYTYEDEEIWTEEEYTDEDESLSADAEPEVTFVLSLPKAEDDAVPIGTEVPATNGLTVLEDKSALRKAPANMSEEERNKVDSDQRERSSRQSGANVSTLRSRFRTPSPPPLPPPEKIAYKRSSFLERQAEYRPKKTYKVVKPVINDDFDKEMAKLREQLQAKQTQFASAVQDINRGFADRHEDLRLKVLEEQRKELKEQASATFRRADQQRQKWLAAVQPAHTLGPDQLNNNNSQEISEKTAVVDSIADDTRKFTKRVRKTRTDENATEAHESTENFGVTAANRSAMEIRSEIAALKKVLTPTENTVPNAAAEVGKRERRKSIPVARRKTMELMNLNPDVIPEVVQQAKRVKKRKHQVHERNRFVRKPFDIDDLLGLSAFSDDFDKMDEHFALDVCMYGAGTLVPRKSRRADPQKVWISQLQDIDRIYKASELRDIKLDAFS